MRAIAFVAINSRRGGRIYLLFYVYESMSTRFLAGAASAYRAGGTPAQQNLLLLGACGDAYRG
jgi:hypothetical protein